MDCATPKITQGDSEAVDCFSVFDRACDHNAEIDLEPRRPNDFDLRRVLVGKSECSNKNRLSSLDARPG